ncbi:MAG: InlB B-repeat-containing protein [Bacteroidales bacterium]|nr:InlB B-repeat-containing protein [Bacteroidales bacterium]
MEKRIKDHLILFELLSYQQIDIAIIKSKYRSLARRFHPDITQRDTNKEMASINDSYEYLQNHILEANLELIVIWKEKEREFLRIYQDATSIAFSIATISQLEKSISLLNTITGYKDTDTLVKKYQERLNYLLKIEEHKAEIYRNNILKQGSFTIERLKKSLSDLQTIVDYKDVNLIILKYQKILDLLISENKAREQLFSTANEKLRFNLSVAEIKGVIADLQKYNGYPECGTLLNEYYQRLNTLVSVKERLKNEKNEFIYTEIVQKLNKSFEIQQYKEVIKKLNKIKDYKNSVSLIHLCEQNIEKLVIANEEKNKEAIYIKAIEFSKSNSKSKLERAKTLFKSIIDFKDSKKKVSEITEAILNNEDQKKKEILYKQAKSVTIHSANANILVSMKRLQIIGDYKDAKTRLLKLENHVFNKIKHIERHVQLTLSNPNKSLNELSMTKSLLKKNNEFDQVNKLLIDVNREIEKVKSTNQKLKEKVIEKQYSALSLYDNETIDRPTLRAKIKTLRKIRYYKDSRELISNYKEHLAFLNRKQLNLVWKKQKPLILSSSVAAICLSVLSYVQIVISIDFKNRTSVSQQAQSLIEEGKYQDALLLLESDPNFGINNDLIQIVYISDYLESSNYEAAINSFIELNGVVKIDYDVNGGINSPSNPPILRRNIDAPTKEGYVLGEWMVEEYHFNLSKEYELNLVLKASYSGLVEYHIIYHLNGGDNNLDNPLKYTIEDMCTLLSPNKMGHTFSNWYSQEDFSGLPIQSIEKGTIGNLTLYAKWTLNTYTITWENYDGTVLEIDENVFYGFMPTYDGVTPERTTNAQFTYSFLGWSPIVSEVAGNTVYTAQFSNTTNTYTITWENYDGTVLEIDENVLYGFMPTYDGFTPERTTNAQFTYSFLGWSPIVSEVAGNTVYTAQFSNTTNSYTITWKNHDDTILKTERISYGIIPNYIGQTPTKIGDYNFSYKFIGWSPQITPVTNNQTYYAQFEQVVNNYFKVTWKNYDGTILEIDEKVLEGSIPIYNGIVPARPEDAQATYSFDKWTPNVSGIYDDITYVATFKLDIKKYVITWELYIDWTKPITILQQKSVSYGEIPVYTGPTPTKPREYYEPNFYRWLYKDFTFAGWSPAITSVTGEKTYRAVFSETIAYY